MSIKSIDNEYQNNIDNFIFNDSISEKPVITQKNHNEIITYDKNKRSIKNSNQQQNQQQNQQPNQQPNQLPNKTSIKKYIIIIIIIVAIVIIALALFIILRKKKKKIIMRKMRMKIEKILKLKRLYKRGQRVMKIQIYNKRKRNIFIYRNISI